MIASLVDAVEAHLVDRGGAQVIWLDRLRGAIFSKLMAKKEKGRALGVDQGKEPAIDRDDANKLVKDYFEHVLESRSILGRDLAPLLCDKLDAQMATAMFGEKSVSIVRSMDQRPNVSLKAAIEKTRSNIVSTKGALAALWFLEQLEGKRTVKVNGIAPAEEEAHHHLFHQLNRLRLHLCELILVDGDADAIAELRQATLLNSFGEDREVMHLFEDCATSPRRIATEKEKAFRHEIRVKLAWTMVPTP